MVRVGLTGGIASGKSMVADELAARGAVIIDADVLAREVVEPGTPAFADRRPLWCAGTQRRANRPGAACQDCLR